MLAGCSFDPRLGIGDAPAAGSDDAGLLPIEAAVDPCPTYAISINGSKYRILDTNAPFWTHDITCENDVAGKTHLAVFDTQVEMSLLNGLLANHQPKPTNGWYFVGAVQTRNSNSPSANWSWFTNLGITTEYWGVFASVPQPNDSDGLESNSENLAVLDTTQGRLLDVSGTTGYGALCECDGHASDPTVHARIPPNPL
jgi:hypothetical protein